MVHQGIVCTYYQEVHCTPEICSPLCIRCIRILCNSVAEYVLTLIILHLQNYQICIIFVRKNQKYLLHNKMDYLNTTISHAIIYWILSIFFLITIWSNNTKMYFVNCFMFVTNQTYTTNIVLYQINYFDIISIGYSVMIQHYLTKH